ncbi:MAG: hypothetical protein KA138_15870 [Saprospiraceae bacterium]|nr:hypothetical protein [Lewinellaceae bacterium]MBP6813007.1 hypothetical protein [Saprospiraceae bacterium]
MTTYDWLSDLHPLFAAQDSWLDGSYNKLITAQLVCPNDTAFSIACGAGLLAEHIRRFKFDAPIIQRLGRVTDARGRSVFQESFLNHLQRLRLRAHVNAAPEGTLLLPGEPMLTIQAPELQFRLLESAIRLLIWKPTIWATKSAIEQWQNGVFSEEETPQPLHFPFNLNGWKMRAQYIGGGNSFDDFESSDDWPGLTKIENSNGHPLAQIRRLFKGEHPLGDVWLTDDQDARASVSHTHIQFMDEKSGKPAEVQMSRFQNLMQPLLVKGHPALSSPSLDYLRQRTWKQLEAFHKIDLEGYQRGWFLE